jgi:GMP synthase-like glutamine amidotransferase
MTQASSRTALVIANSTDADAGYVGERLIQRGYTLRTLLRDQDQVPVDVAAEAPVDVVLLLGSDWSVHSPDNADSLARECALARSARDQGVPVLGLCYGAQVLAEALGGRVFAAPAPEVGWIHVESLDPGLVPAGPWLAFHLDVVEPPPGADVVARNGCGYQAFLLPGVLGVQFHPEVRPETLDDWCQRFPDLLRDAGLRRDELVAEARKREPEARVAAHDLVDAFLAKVAPPATG